MKVKKITVVLEFDEAVDYEDKYELSESIKEVAELIQEGYLGGYAHGNIDSWETECEFEEYDEHQVTIDGFFEDTKENK